MTHDGDGHPPVPCRPEHRLELGEVAGNTEGIRRAANAKGGMPAHRLLAQHSMGEHGDEPRYGRQGASPLLGGWANLGTTLRARG